MLEEEVDLNKYWIDPFANRNKVASVLNDLNMKYETDYHLDALDFLKMFKNSWVDEVLYDPPYSPRQISECYNNFGYTVTWDTTKAPFWVNHKREISRIVKVEGKVITFGWNSGGIGYKYGFKIERILFVPHGGWHNDTICTVEVKTHTGKFHNSKTEPMEIKTEMRTMTKSDEKLISKLKELPADFWDFCDDDTKEFTHGLHNYPAMMVCPISRNIIRIVKEIQPVNALLDPFAGSGTVLVEGMLSGIRRVTGNDINPLALLLTKVKTTAIQKESLNKEVDELFTRVKIKREALKELLASVDSYVIETLGLDITAKKGWGDEAHKYLQQYCGDTGLDVSIPAFKNLGYWFRPRVILELSILKSEIEKIEEKNIRDFVFIALSENIRFVSNRRNGEFKMYRMKSAKIKSFNPDVYSEFEKILYRNICKMNDFYKKMEESDVCPEVVVCRNNTCTLEDVPNDTYDLIITSPPYGDSRTTVAYGEYSRLSLQWINLFGLTEKEIMGFDRTLMGGKKYRNGFEFTLQSDTLRKSLKKIVDIDIERAGDVYSFYADLDASIGSVAMKTKSGGYQFWVVGNRTVKNELLKTDVIITELASQYGLAPIYTIDRNIPNKVMPSQNSPTNVAGATGSTITMEHIIVLRKN